MQPLAQVGRYRIEREVARGGMGAVYRARTPEGRPVALKLLLAGRAASPLQRRRVTTEVQALLRLRHPHVVELLDAGEHRGELPGAGVAASAAKPGEPGVPYLVMEWVQGETLAARLEREGPLPWAAAVEVTRQLAGALAHCHAQGVLHRDLKPANVMLRASDGAPLLTDFGLSKDLASEGSLASTGAGSVRGRWLGTPGYWPPEQARGELDAIGPRSDLYGLGATLYAALTGSAPHTGESLSELLLALERPPDPPSRRHPGLPPWLDAVCLRALAIEPERRQASATDLERELGEGLAGRLTEQGRVREVAAPLRLPATRVARAAGRDPGAGADVLHPPAGGRAPWPDERPARGLIRPSPPAIPFPGGAS